MIVGLDAVRRIVRMLPPGCLKQVTLKSRQPRETVPTSVPYAYARRKSAKTNELILAGANIGENWIVWELFKTIETVDPKNGDAILDDQAVTWQLKKILGISIMGRVFNCLCLQNV